MSPLEYALKAQHKRVDSDMPEGLPVGLDIYRALLKDQQTKKNPTDYKKVVNDFLFTLIQEKEGDKQGQVLPQVKKEVLNLLLEEQFEFIDTDKALQLCSECKADALS